MSIRRSLSDASPHVSLKTAWRILIQASRRLRRAGHVVPVQGRGEIDRFLALEAPSDWDPSAFKRLLKGLVDSNSDHVQDQYAEQINNRIARNLQPTQVDEVYLYVAGGPPWLSRAQIDEWLGTREGCLKCTPREAAALVHHLDGLPIGGSPLSVTSDNARPLPAIRREDRARQRARGSSLWLPNYDEIGRLSLTPRSLADAHAARLLEFADVVFDPFCGLGGDAIAAAKARYGFVSPPGMRFSIRRLVPEPTTRKPAVRLSFDHAIFVGAQDWFW